nr:uncharacterized protein LOC117221483 [Megalopta genalis]
MPQLTRPFLPTVEDASVAGNDAVFLDECPISLMTMGRIREGPKMLGFVRNEVLAFLNELIDRSKIAVPDVTALVSYVRSLAQFVSNVSYSAEIDLTQRFFAAHNGDRPVYYYLMTYKDFPRHLLTPYQGNVSTHGDDIALLFVSREFGIAGSTDPNDRLSIFRRRFVRLWVNYAKHGDPTPAFANPIDVVWEPSGALGRQLDIGSSFEMRNRALRDSLPEILFYLLLPNVSGCHKVSYETSYDQLFRN